MQLGQTKYATAYQTSPQDPQNAGLRSYPNIARVTITLDPLPRGDSEPGSAVVGLTLLRKDAARAAGSSPTT